jgi:hypothetical protein
MSTLAAPLGLGGALLAGFTGGEVTWTQLE